MIQNTQVRDTHQTDTVFSARDDARSQSAEDSPYRCYLPATESPYAPADVDRALLTWAETVAPGGYTHRVVARGTRIRLEDLEGEACAHILLFNADEPWERLNVADTVKIPWQAYLTTGHPLLSGDGRVLATIVADDSRHHDTFCGATTDLFNEEKFGDARLHGQFPSGQTLLLQGAGKHGLDRRDLAPSVSFFQGVRVEEDGGLVFLGSAGPGHSVDLLAELPLIVLIANAPHPLDPRPDYVSGPLRVHAWRDEPTGPSSPFYTRSPESHRAYLNTIDYVTSKGL